MFLIMVSTFAMQVESSRPLFVDHHMMIKIAKAYSGPSNRGTGHAISHKVLPNTSSFNGFKLMGMAYSGPSRKGAGHGLSNLLRKNLNTTSFKRFNQAYSGPSDSGTGH